MIPEHLYVHAPFCARRCSYCDFAVHVASDPPVRAWVDAIGAEMGIVAAAEGWGRPLQLRTLYLGGGTPSLLGPGAVPALLEGLSRSVETVAIEEFTAEANPESFTPELAADWREAGVDRLSFGAQTFHAPSLRWMGRLHGPDGPGRAVSIARAEGFENVGLDLIFALPERLGRDVADDLDRMVALAPEHISVYGLSVERGTPLGRWVDEGREVVPEQERYQEEYLAVAERLTAAGYVHYEVSNFALPGCESRHNSAYWRGVAYVGLGNGAHSFLPPRRWWNHRDWGEYRLAVAEGRSPRSDEETLDVAASRLESYWLGLRTRNGVPVEELGEAVRAVVRGWMNRGWAVREGRRIRLTREGWLLLDRLTVELDGAASGVATG
jgi:oxygen-independent coproporphyrinogen III oxidase